MKETVGIQGPPTSSGEKFNSLWHYWRIVDKDDLGGHGAINGLNLITSINLVNW